MRSTNAPNGAEAMLHMLAAHDVRDIFGLCGDTSLPLYDALARPSVGIRHILTRDERHAAYAADAYARLTGRVGVCEGPSGGGATHILPGVVEANQSSVPVLAINTDVATSSEGRFPLTELDQESLFRPLTKFNRVIRRADGLPRTVRAAFRAMTTGRPGASHLVLPFDVQLDTVPAEELWADARFGRFPALRPAADPEDLATLLESLFSASRPVAIVGGGITLSRAEDEFRSFVEALDLPVCTSVSGQGALAETHPNCVGVVGSNGGTPATRAVIDSADFALFLGCRAGSVTTERWTAPAHGRRIAHIDIDPDVPGTNYATEAPVCADLRLALDSMNRLIEKAANPPRFGGARIATVARDRKRAAFQPLAASDESPLRPERVVKTVSDHAPDDTVLVVDPGTPCPYFSAHFALRRPGRRLITNRAHGALGYALGASIGAQLARPNARVIAAMGDGSFGFAVGELETVRRLELPILFVVFSNAAYGWIKAGQRSGYGARYFSVDFSRTEHAAVAAAYGLRSWTVSEPSELGPALRGALAEDGPSLIDVRSQPLEEAAAPVSEWIA